MLPRRLPNFGKANNFVCLTIELPFFFKHTWIKLRREKLLCSASAGSHVRCRDKIIFFPVHLTLLSMVFTMETRNTSGSFLELPMTPTLDPATGTNSVASMEASQSPSLASIPSVESSNSGGNNKTNDSKGKKKVKHETWSQAEQKLLVQLWAENHELLESRGPEPHGGKSQKS